MTLILEADELCTGHSASVRAYVHVKSDAKSQYCKCMLGHCDCDRMRDRMRDLIATEDHLAQHEILTTSGNMHM